MFDRSGRLKVVVNAYSQKIEGCICMLKGKSINKLMVSSLCIASLLSVGYSEAYRVLDVAAQGIEEISHINFIEGEDVEANRDVAIRSLVVLYNLSEDEVDRYSAELRDVETVWSMNGILTDAFVSHVSSLGIGDMDDLGEGRSFVNHIIKRLYRLDDEELMSVQGQVDLAQDGLELEDAYISALKLNLINFFKDGGNLEVYKQEASELFDKFRGDQFISLGEVDQYVRDNRFVGKELDDSQDDSSIEDDEVSSEWVEDTGNEWVDEELESERQLVLVEVEGYHLLGDDELNTYKGRITQAQSIDELGVIKQEAQQLQVSREALMQAIEEAKVLHGSMGYLGDSSDSYYERIVGATNKGDLELVVQEMQEYNDLQKQKADDEAVLQGKKDEAIAKVRDLGYLVKQEVDSFIEDINNSSTEDEVLMVLETAEGLNNTYRSQKEEELAQLQESIDLAIAEVQGLGYLDESDKESFIGSLRESLTLAEVETTLKKAVGMDKLLGEKDELAKQHLRDVVRNTKLDLAELSELSEDELNGYFGRLDSVDSLEGVQAIVDEAVALNNERLDFKELEAYKQELTDEVGALTYLSDDEVAHYTQLIGNTGTLEELELIRVEMHELNNQKELSNNQRKVEEFKATIVEKIKNLGYLDDDSRVQFLNKLDGLNDIEAIQGIYYEAVELDTKRGMDLTKLQNDKIEAIRVINQLSNLSVDQKQAYITKVKESTTIEVIKGIIDEATKHNNQIASDKISQQKLDEARVIAKDMISRLRALSDEERINFGIELGRTVAVDQVNEVVSRAQELNAKKQGELDAQKQKDLELAQQLQAKKVEAIQTITKLGRLGADKKLVYNQRIKEAKDEVSVGSILQEAIDEDRKLVEVTKVQTTSTPITTQSTTTTSPLTTVTTTTKGKLTESGDSSSLVWVLCAIGLLGMAGLVLFKPEEAE